MSDVQHKQWFIKTMIPHIRVPLMQQNIVSQSDALSLSIKLEASPDEETSAGMMYIQSKLTNLTLQLHDINKGREVHEELWCMRCKIQVHHKYSCLTFMNYLASGAPNPINTQGIPSCRILQTRGHHSKECLYLQKIVSAPAILYYKFCRLVGPNKKYCRAYQLLQEKIVYTYLMKNVNRCK